MNKRKSHTRRAAPKTRYSTGRTKKTGEWTTLTKSGHRAAKAPVHGLGSRARAAAAAHTRKLNSRR